MLSSLTELRDKNAIRAYCKKRRFEISESERKAYDLSLCAFLREALGEYGSVLCFFPSKGEPNILPVAEQLIKDARRVCFPRSKAVTRELEFYRVNDIFSDFAVGAFGIPEPNVDCEKITGFDDAVCVVPALAYDLRGFRVGYGKGFYDRFLSDKRVRTVGVCYSEFLTNALPTDKNDISVDIIITEKGVVTPEALKLK